MRISGTATVAAPRPRVWAALRDPAVLVEAIPGCERLETVGADTYAMTVTAGVAAIRGTYVGEVALSDPDPPGSFALRARGQGAPGTVDANVAIRLSEDGDGGTRIEYDADATIGGMIGGVGQRMLGTAARRTAGEFFAAVERTLTEPGPVPAPGEPEAAGPGPGSGEPGPAGPGAAGPGAVEPVEPPGAARPGRVFTAPARAKGGNGEVLAAFAAGAAVALAGVALGHLLGRRSRTP